jgi:hypothetical protein
MRDITPMEFCQSCTYRCSVPVDASPCHPLFPLSLRLLLLLLQVMADLGGSKSGRQSLASAMQLCPDTQLNSLTDVLALRGWLASAW